MHKSLLTSALIAALLSVGCSTDPQQSRAVPVQVPTTPDGAPVTRLGPTANFDPSTGAVPTPNNLVYAGSTDATLNIPVADPTNFGDPLVAINALDGWSTNAPITMTFSAAVDASTVTAGGTVRVFEVTLSGPGGAVTSVVRQLGANEFAVAMATPTTLAIIPLRPLAPSSHYAFLITDGITDGEGGHVQSSQVYAITKNTDPLVVDGVNQTVLPDANATALEPLRQLTNATETALAAASGIARERMALTWVMSTQSVGDVLAKVAETAEAADHLFGPTGMTTAAIGAPGTADIWFGWIEVPYYLQAPSDVTPADPTRVVSGHWQGAGGSNLTRFNPTPVARSTQRIPAILTIPNTMAMPAGGWPLMIFQHGITGNRSQALAIADAAASAGRAMIAIDQPLHGITDAAGPLFAFRTDNPAGVYATPGFGGTTERHFFVDLVDNATSAPGPDGQIDGSGTHTINLQRLLTSRDNLRQASADIITLVATVSELTAGPNTFDSSAVHFVGHSLGGIVGIPAVAAMGDGVATASYKAPGGGVARLLHGSASFGPRIRAGLAGAGVDFPSPAYDQFMFAAQTVIDSADPLNYAAAASAAAPTHMMLVIGDGNAMLPDQVVPITVAGAPLAGGAPLAALMGLQLITETTTDASGLRGQVRFVAGDHGSLLSPAASPAATVEMQTQVATFMATFGTTIPVNNPAVVQQP